MTSATIATEIGDIQIDLFTQSAPKAAANFIALAGKGFYDDVVFHGSSRASSSRPATGSSARRRA